MTGVAGGQPAIFEFGCLVALLRWSGATTTCDPVPALIECSLLGT
jgi:hypothetical protein